MSYGIRCGQRDCKNFAFYRYTWPGQNEAAICTEHVNKLRATADAIGLPLWVQSLTAADHENLAHPLAAPSESQAK